MKGATMLMAFAAVLDVASNAFLKKSDGFKRWGWGIGALGLVIGAFGLLGQALHTVSLSTAYATWGAFGLVLTALLSRWLDGTRLTPAGWSGLALIVLCVVLLHI